jgi:hypothetical protein
MDPRYPEVTGERLKEFGKWADQLKKELGEK